MMLVILFIIENRIRCHLNHNTRKAEFERVLMEKITNGFPKVRMSLLLGAGDDLRDNFGSGKWWRSSAKK